MRNDTREMYEATLQAKSVLNSYTKNRNFKYKTREDAMRGLDDKYARACAIINRVRPDEHCNGFSTAATIDRDTTLEYLNRYYDKLVSFVNEKKF